MGRLSVLKLVCIIAVAGSYKPGYTSPFLFLGVWGAEHKSGWFFGGWSTFERAAEAETNYGLRFCRHVSGEIHEGNMSYSMWLWHGGTMSDYGLW